MDNSFSCSACPQLVASRSQIVLPTWQSGARLLAIGEAPGEKEDARGEGFVGTAGKTLDALLVRHGFARGPDYGVANIVRCRPPGNRKPNSPERDACLPHLADFLNAVRPPLLLLVGGTAANNFFGTGALWHHIQRVRLEGAYVALSEIALPLRRRLEELDLDYWRRGLRCIPMPHTSGLAWNRRCPTAHRWSEIGDEMVRLAVQYLRGPIVA